MAPTEETPENYFKELTDKIEEYRKNPLTAFFTDIGRAISDLDVLGGGINRVFGETRERISEIKTALADTTPRIDRLGGSIKDAQATIQDIALGTKRNVIATTEQTEKLYAAFKVTGVEVKSLVDGFANVGVGVGQMSKQIEESVNYIRSIGGNTKEVYKIVTDNMDQLNRYQFEGGVQGLTKMAAQASMLRFNMNETFRLADKVLTPEGAIQTAAAFQRLGVSAGNLVDPFQLMNQSINDPQGLQNSLTDVAKQFTYFDEKTKSFKINPQGVLTLKEMEQQTGVSAAEMSKLGLAAAEAGQRISSIKGIGLNLSEEDNQLLSNISRMGDGGEYEIAIKDTETGERRWEKLTSISQDQLNATLQEQKEGPKGLEEIARSQLDYSEMVAGDVRSIYHGLMYGFGSDKTITREVEGGRKLTDAITGTLSDMFGTSKSGRAMARAGIDDVKEFFKTQEKEGTKEALASLLEKINKQAETPTLGREFKETMIEFKDKYLEKLTGDSEIEKKGRTLIDRLLVGDKKIDATNTKQDVKSQQINSLLYGKSGLGQQLGTAGVKKDETLMTTKSTVDVGGKIIVEFNTPNGTELTKKMFDDWANSPQTKQYFANLSSPKNSTKAPNNTTYGN